MAIPPQHLEGLLSQFEKLIAFYANSPDQADELNILLVNVSVCFVAQG